MQTEKQGMMEGEYEKLLEDSSEEVTENTLQSDISSPNPFADLNVTMEAQDRTGLALVKQRDETPEGESALAATQDPSASEFLSTAQMGGSVGGEGTSGPTGVIKPVEVMCEPVIGDQSRSLKKSATASEFRKAVQWNAFAPNFCPIAVAERLYINSELRHLHATEWYKTLILGCVAESKPFEDEQRWEGVEQEVRLLARIPLELWNCEKWLIRSIVQHLCHKWKRRHKRSTSSCCLLPSGKKALRLLQEVSRQMEGAGVLHSSKHRRRTCSRHSQVPKPRFRIVEAGSIAAARVSSLADLSTSSAATTTTTFSSTAPATATSSMELATTMLTSQAIVQRKSPSEMTPVMSSIASTAQPLRTQLFAVPKPVPPRTSHVRFKARLSQGPGDTGDLSTRSITSTMPLTVSVKKNLSVLSDPTTSKLFNLS